MINLSVIVPFYNEEKFLEQSVNRLLENNIFKKILLVDNNSTDQSGNIDNKENDVSNQDNAPEDTSSQEDQITENDELSSQKTEEINTEELKNTISNNDARLEQLEKEHETL